MKDIPYGRQHIDNADIAEVVKILKSDWITCGPKIDEFEKAFAEYCGAKYAVAVSSGTAALHIACLAGGLGEGKEAITTPITFLATANSIVYTGAKPVFADIERGSINISPGQVKKKVTGRTKGIMPVHFAGLPCDMPKIRKIARKNKLIVIEDACHALGAEYKENGKWIKVGSCKHSDMAAFSFHPVKHITTGEGGAVTTNNRKMREKLKALRSHGVSKTYSMNKKHGAWYYEMKDLGFNYRITDFQCALGLSQLKKIKMFITKRREIVQKYHQAFKENPFLSVPLQEEDKRSAWHLYMIRLRLDKIKKTRREIFDQLRSKGIGVHVHYIPLHMQPYYREHFGYKKGDFPEAESFYNSALTLPVFPDMRKKEISTVIDNVLKIVR